MRYTELEQQLNACCLPPREGMARIYFCPLEGDDRGGRATRERRGVEELLQEAFGENARYGHRPNGAPIVEGVEAEISVSHCREMAVMGVVPRGWRIGVDAESIDRGAQLRRVSARFLSEAEMGLMGSDLDLARAWTVKEAVYKAEQRAGWELSEIPLGENGMVVTPRGSMRLAVLEDYGRGVVVSVVVGPVNPSADSLKPDMK